MNRSDESSKPGEETERAAWENEDDGELDEEGEEEDAEEEDRTLFAGTMLWGFVVKHAMQTAVVGRLGFIDRIWHGSALARENLAMQLFLGEHFVRRFAEAANQEALLEEYWQAHRERVKSDAAYADVASRVEGRGPAYRGVIAAAPENGEWEKAAQLCTDLAGVTTPLVWVYLAAEAATIARVVVACLQSCGIARIELAPEGSE